MANLGNQILLSWTARTPISDGQDPLGLNLRVSARLGGNLLFCITSVTRRARYYSLLPWAISTSKKLGKSKPNLDSLLTLEKAFTLGCILHHKGQACLEGRLTGSDSLIPRYEHYAESKNIDLAKLPFAQSPASRLYGGSLVNLCFFETEEEAEEFDDEKVVEAVNLSAANLSDLGTKVASAYDRVLCSAGLFDPVTGSWADRKALEKWGEVGGLCELRKGGEDRRILREVFFNLNKNESIPHELRRRSLLLIMFLSNIFNDNGEDLSIENFGDAVYFEQLIDSKGKSKTIRFPEALKNIVQRWRMFYFHYYFSAALENLFVSVVSRSNLNRLSGITLEQLFKPLGSRSFDKELRELVEVKYQGNFLDLTPRALFRDADIKLANFDATSSLRMEKLLKIDNMLSEWPLHYALADRDRFGSDGSIGVSVILLTTLALRYLQWENTDQGNWLAQAVENNPYENITVPVLVHELKQQFNDVWGTPYREILAYVLRRLVVRLHASLAYDKKGTFFYLDGEKILGYGQPYDTPSYGNPRFNNAVMILKDLGLLKDSGAGSKGLIRTAEGERFLAEQLKEAARS